MAKKRRYPTGESAARTRRTENTYVQASETPGQEIFRNWRAGDQSGYTGNRASMGGPRSSPNDEPIQSPPRGASPWGKPTATGTKSAGVSTAYRAPKLPPSAYRLPGNKTQGNYAPGVRPTWQGGEAPHTTNTVNESRARALGAPYFVQAPKPKPPKQGPQGGRKQV